MNFLHTFSLSPSLNLSIYLTPRVSTLIFLFLFLYRVICVAVWQKSAAWKSVQRTRSAHRALSFTSLWIFNMICMQCITIIIIIVIVVIVIVVYIAHLFDRCIMILAADSMQMALDSEKCSKVNMHEFRRTINVNMAFFPQRYWGNVSNQWIIISWWSVLLNFHHTHTLKDEWQKEKTAATEEKNLMNLSML